MLERVKGEDSSSSFTFPETPNPGGLLIATIPSEQKNIYKKVNGKLEVTMENVSNDLLNKIRISIQ